MMESHSSQSNDNDAIPPGLASQAQAVIASSSGDPACVADSSSLETTNREKGGYNDLPSTTEKSKLNTHKLTHGNSPHPQGAENDTLAEDVPPPAYSEAYGQINLSQNGLNTVANLQNNGRVNINISDESKLVSNMLVPALRNQLKIRQERLQHQSPPSYVPPSLGGTPGQVPPPPPMNIVIHVVGSRGDVQPFVAIGKVLKESYGHRVRLATHPTFREFVTDNGLEFFSIGGDPAELMAFMVKNPGLMPGKDALRSGDVGKRRKSMYEIVQGCWRSCFEAGDGTGIAVSDDQPLENFDSSNRPFVADAIIANPPSFAHIHCAEKMGIPLHLMFTMPWSPTQSFPHPLADIQQSSTDVSMTNFLSYVLVELMTWQGLGDIINRFREKSLGLEPLSLMWAPGLVNRLRIPYTYCWSPALIPKPKDWGPHIDISGFYFLSLANNYEPPTELLKFLDSGPPPIYIGFGSIVLDDPNAMTKLIFDAVKLSGQRALVSKGWGGFGADAMGLPDNILMLGNVPHDWLFQHVSCIVHHGGAGTTAAGIALGKPTVIVPFFGDQPFWGAMIARAGAGPTPIPNKRLNAENLANAIVEALNPSTLERARELGARVASEKGTDIGAKSFHDHLDIEKMRCCIASERAAVWETKTGGIRLSAFAAAVLGNEGLLDFSDLKLYRSKEYDSEDAPWDPIGGAASALAGTIGSLMMGGADIPTEIFKIFSSKSGKQKGPGEANKPSDLQDVDSSGGSPPPTDTVPSIPARAESAPNKGSEQLELNEHTSSVASDTDLARESGSAKPAPEAKKSEQISMDAAIDAGRGVGRIVDAGLKSPMDFTMALAKGFHNAPKLYGDETVRPIERVTGFQSGLKAAGKGFGFGLYDGISGLVTQPLEGAKKDGFAGLVKGFGKGIGGVVLKPSAAAWSVPGYTFKGIYKEIRKMFGSSVQNYIIAARTAQGFEEWTSSSPEQRIEIISGWNEIQKNAKQKYRNAKPLPTAQAPQSSPTYHHSNVQAQAAKTPQNIYRDTAIFLAEPETNKGFSDSDPYEQAIRQSVAATSTGDADEDKMIERAIRASLTELRQQPRQIDDEDALAQAIKASVLEADRAHANASTPQFREQIKLNDNSQAGTQTFDPSTQDGTEHSMAKSDPQSDKQGGNLPRQAENLHGEISDENDAMGKTIADSIWHHQQEETRLRADEALIESIKEQSMSDKTQ